MKRRITLVFLVFAMVLCISQVAFAENEVSSTQAAAATTGTTTPAAPAQTVDNAVYSSLISKIAIKDNLILQENQVCKQIKEQESINKTKVSAVIEKTQSYSTSYNKIIDDIKLLIDPIKYRETLYYKNSKAGAQTDITSQEAGIYDSQISSLNLAIKAMRQSMNYINLESVEYHKKVEAVQKNIDSINQAIEDLNKQIIDEKTSKDKEWNNFCTAMVRGDLKTADECYDNMLKFKRDIIQNYNLILQYKQSIDQQLSTLV